MWAGGADTGSRYHRLAPAPTESGAAVGNHSQATSRHMRVVSPATMVNSSSLRQV